MQRGEEHSRQAEEIENIEALRQGFAWSSQEVANRSRVAGLRNQRGQGSR